MTQLITTKLTKDQKITLKKEGVVKIRKGDDLIYYREDKYLVTWMVDGTKEKIQKRVTKNGLDQILKSVDERGRIQTTINGLEHHFKWIDFSSARELRPDMEYGVFYNPDDK